MEAWDAAQYLKFAGPRLRPAIDLLARIEAASPAAIADLGCGTGTATRLLAKRWPGAKVCGVDASPGMLAVARSESADDAIAWIEADVAAWSPAVPLDVLFSNAALHWLDGHARLLPRLVRCLRPGGTLAVQMPRNHLSPSHTCIGEAAAAGPWGRRLDGILRPFPVEAPAAYHDLLVPVAASVDIWETEYLHVLTGDNPVVEWTRSTALKPVLALLDEGEREAFLADYGARIAAAYPRRADGATLFPFRRLFIVARM